MSLIDEAKLHIAKGEVDAALQKLSECLNGDFFNAEALFMLGACLQGKGMNGLAAVVTSAAIDSRAAQGKKFPEALVNLGCAYKAEHDNATAERIWNDALRLETVPSERAKILCNMAGLHVNEGSPEEAVKLCDMALKEDPNNAGARANRGMASLELQRWREGWQGFRATYAAGDREKRKYRDLPEWDGKPGKKVIVWGDQGVGDEIFFAQCLSDMMRHSAKVILDCHPRLINTFKRTFPECEAHGTRKTLAGPEIDWVRSTDADCSIGIADLPGFFRNKTEDWDGKPYLKVPRMPKIPGAKPAIGISWVGGTKRTRTDLRSMTLHDLEPIVGAIDADWYSLQYTPDAAREVAAFREETGLDVKHLPGLVECFDYDQTVKFIAGLDLVITVCTTVHHVGGALGVPTWTMVPSRPSWRYGGKSERLPWYGSARCFRQQKDGDWAGVIQRIADELPGFTGYSAAA